MYDSECTCLWSSAQFCRTKIAGEDEQLAPNRSQLYLKICSLQSSLRRRRRLSWSCDCMPICINISLMTAFTATEYCQKWKRRPCSLQSGSCPVNNASLSEIPSYFEAEDVVLWILSFSACGSMGWWGTYQTECLQLGSATVMKFLSKSFLMVSS